MSAGTSLPSHSPLSVSGSVSDRRPDWHTASYAHLPGHPPEKYSVGTDTLRSPRSYAYPVPENYPVRAAVSDSVWTLLFPSFLRSIPPIL